MSTLTIQVSKNFEEGEGWKLVTSGTNRKAPAPPNGLKLQNRCTALKAEEDLDMPTSEEPSPPNPKRCKGYQEKTASHSNA